MSFQMGFSSSKCHFYLHGLTTVTNVTIPPHGDSKDIQAPLVMK
jgi:hypothetical protein